MSIASSSETVRSSYDDWHRQLGDEEGYDQSAPWHRMVRAHLGPVAGKRVLEIGCGRGGFSRFLAEQGAHLTAADYSEAAADFARDLLADFPRVDVRVEDIQAISFPENSFDLVISCETLEHVPDPERGLAELVRVTRPGGRLLITTPNYFGGLGLYRWYREVSGKGFSECGQPLNQKTTLKGRVASLKRLGCRIDATDGCGHYLYLPGRNPQRLPLLDHPKPLMKWLAAHSLTVATKPDA